MAKRTTPLARTRAYTALGYSSLPTKGALSSLCIGLAFSGCLTSAASKSRPSPSPPPSAPRAQSSTPDQARAETKPQAAPPAPSSDSSSTPNSNTPPTLPTHAPTSPKMGSSPTQAASALPPPHSGTPSTQTAGADPIPSAGPLPASQAASGGQVSGSELDSSLTRQKNVARLERELRRSLDEAAACGKTTAERGGTVPSTPSGTTASQAAGTPGTTSTAGVSPTLAPGTASVPSAGPSSAPSGGTPPGTLDLGLDTATGGSGSGPDSSPTQAASSLPPPHSGTPSTQTAGADPIPSADPPPASRSASGGHLPGSELDSSLTRQENVARLEKELRHSLNEAAAHGKITVERGGTASSAPSGTVASQAAGTPGATSAAGVSPTLAPGTASVPSAGPSSAPSGGTPPGTLDLGLDTATGGSGSGPDSSPTQAASSLPPPHSGTPSTQTAGTDPIPSADPAPASRSASGGQVSGSEPSSSLTRQENVARLERELRRSLDEAATRGKTAAERGGTASSAPSGTVASLAAGTPGATPTAGMSPTLAPGTASVPSAGPSSAPSGGTSPGTLEPGLDTATGGSDFGLDSSLTQTASSLPTPHSGTPSTQMAGGDPMPPAGSLPASQSASGGQLPGSELDSSLRRQENVARLERELRRSLDEAATRGKTTAERGRTAPAAPSGAVASQAAGTPGTPPTTPSLPGSTAGVSPAPIPDPSLVPTAGMSPTLAPGTASVPSAGPSSAPSGGTPSGTLEPGSDTAAGGSGSGPDSSPTQAASSLPPPHSDTRSTQTAGTGPIPSAGPPPVSQSASEGQVPGSERDPSLTRQENVARLERELRRSLDEAAARGKTAVERGGTAPSTPSGTVASQAAGTPGTPPTAPSLGGLVAGMSPTLTPGTTSVPSAGPSPPPSGGMPRGAPMSRSDTAAWGSGSGPDSSPTQAASSLLPPHSGTPSTQTAGTDPIPSAGPPSASQSASGGQVPGSERGPSLTRQENVARLERELRRSLDEAAARGKTATETGGTVPTTPSGTVASQTAGTPGTPPTAPSLPGLAAGMSSTLTPGTSLTPNVGVSPTLTPGTASVPGAGSSSAPNGGTPKPGSGVTVGASGSGSDPSLTRRENVARLERALYRSLNEADALRDAGANGGGGLSASSGMSIGRSGAGNAEDSDDEATVAANGGFVASIASSEIAGTEKASQDQTAPPALAGMAGLETEAKAGEVLGAGGSGDREGANRRAKLAGVGAALDEGEMEDIPAADNDSVLAAQIRAAAEREQDPQKRACLWREYRRYKGLPEKSGEPNAQLCTTTEY